MSSKSDFESMDIDQTNDSDTCPNSPSESTHVKTPKTVFTPKQLCYLEDMFYKNQFPNSKEKLQIAKHLNLTVRNVQTWFQNKRAKSRRKERKRKEEKQKQHQPKPPSFWPKHLPFDSRFTDTNGSVVPGGKKEQSSPPSSENSTSSIAPSSNSSISSDLSTISSTSSLSTPGPDNPDDNETSPESQDHVSNKHTVGCDKPKKLSNREKRLRVSNTVRRQSLATPSLRDTNPPNSSTLIHQSTPVSSPTLPHQASSGAQHDDPHSNSLQQNLSLLFQQSSLTHVRTLTQQEDVIQHPQPLPQLTLFPIVKFSFNGQQVLYKTTPGLKDQNMVQAAAVISPVISNAVSKPSHHGKDILKPSEAPTRDQSGSVSNPSIIKSLLSSNNSSLYNDDALLLLANCAVSVASTQNNSNSKSNDSDQQRLQPPQYIASETTSTNCVVDSSVLPKNSCSRFDDASNSNITTATGTNCSYSVCTMKVSNSRPVSNSAYVESQSLDHTHGHTDTNEVTSTETELLHNHSGVHVVVPSTGISGWNSKFSETAGINLESKKTDNHSPTPNQSKITPNDKRFTIAESPFPLADIGEEEWHVIESTLTPRKGQSVLPALPGSLSSSTASESQPQELQCNNSRMHLPTGTLKCPTNSQGNNIRMYSGTSSLTIEHPSYINDPDGAFSLLAKTSQ